jgi:hypothetical protein
MKKKSIKLLNTLIFLFILLASGCQQEKKETPQPSVETKKDTSGSMQQGQIKTDSLKKGSESVPDITGTWDGKFDSHTTTLKITEQDSLNFKGNITIHYRQVINQQVSGKFDPVKKTLTMKDLLHSRYQGTYDAKLSEDLRSFSGTFTMSVDKKKLNFNLMKK